MGVPKPKVGATSAFTAFSGRKQSDDHAAAILRLRQSSWQRGQVGGWGVGFPYALGASACHLQLAPAPRCLLSMPCLFLCCLGGSHGLLPPGKVC